MTTPDSRDAALRRLVDQVATARDVGGQLDIRGGGTKAFYGGPPRGEPLDVRPLHGISSYEPSELVVTARAGTPLAELQAALAEKGQCLPFDPPHFAPGGTVGGMVAAGLAGPSRPAVGSVRDHVLGVTILNGRGEVLTFGGQVMKNVAGYDVSRLMVGSLGVLGVICEVSIKVLPVPACQATLAFAVDRTEALRLLTSWAARPLPIRAAAWDAGRLQVLLAGARAAVDASVRSLGGERVDDADAEARWDDLRDHRSAFFSSEPGAGPAAALPLWRLSVPRAAAQVDLPGTCLVDWAGAQRWWRTDAPATQVREAATRVGGHATRFRGGDAADSAFTPLSVPLRRIHHALKHEFDPAGVFNPGRLFPDL